ERAVREFDKHLDKCRHRPLVEIRRRDVAGLVADVTERHSKSAGHRVRMLLAAMFKGAAKNEWGECNPVHGVDDPTYEPRERYLLPEEVGAFFTAVDQLQNETSRDFIKLAAFTGARRGNVASMRWQEIDLQRRVWTIPREKFK